MPAKREDSSDDLITEPRGCGGLFFFVMLFVAALWGAGLGVFVYILQEAEDTIAVLEDFRPKIGSRVYSSDGGELGEFATEARQIVSLNEIPLHVQKAFIATEDDKFYTHRGVRPLSLAKAVTIDAIRTNRLRGASTITQQIVRNVEGTGVSKETTVQRKLREMLVALQVERRFTKDEILEMYLNQIFLGISAHGVEAASRQYFAKSVTDLNLSEAAMLAGLTRAPNTNQPFRSPENARTRRDIVLRQMLDNGFIAEEEYDAARNASLEESVVTPDERTDLAADTGGWKPGTFKAPYFVEEVRKFVSRPPHPFGVNATHEELFEGGLEIFTTIDMRLQQAAEEVLLKALQEFDANKLESLKRQDREHEFIPVSGALVCLDNRHGADYDYRGYVRAMIGGRNFDRKKFNDATQALRQPGSSVKPFVWLAALDNGYTPSTIVVDEPIERFDGAGNVWAPENFEDEFQGPIPIRKALELSINIVSVKLVEQLGMPIVRSYLKEAGFKQPISDVVGLTLGLGTPLTTVLDQAVCYSTLVNGGVRFEPTMVTRIIDRDGLVRFAASDFRDELQQRVFPRDVSYQVVHLLQGVCEPARGYSVTGRRTERLGRPRGGKTGTTNESRNVWFCGFTPQFTCVVWIGYDDNTSLGKGVAYTGGALASPIWTDFMIRAHEGLPVEEFEVPPGVEFYKIDRATGAAGGDYLEAYIRDTRPPDRLPVIWTESGATFSSGVVEVTRPPSR